MVELSISVLSIVIIAALWIFLFWIYADYRIDVFRQQVFSLRDELFDEAARGHIPFGKGYGFMRSTMNGCIRFAHEINLINLIVLRLNRYRPADAQRYNCTLLDSICELSPNQSKLILEYKNKLDVIVLRHVLMSSPVIMSTIAIPVVMMVIMQFCMSFVTDKLKGPLSDVSALAFAAGDDSGRR